MIRYSGLDPGTEGRIRGKTGKVQIKPEVQLIAVHQCLFVPMANVRY